MCWLVETVVNIIGIAVAFWDGFGLGLGWLSKLGNISCLEFFEKHISRLS